jgi:hypothetical protein
MSTYTHFSPVDRWSIYFFVKPLWSPSSRWDIFSFSISFFAHECCPSLFPLLIMEIDHSVVPLFFSIPSVAWGLTIVRKQNKSLLTLLK